MDAQETSLCYEEIDFVQMGLCPADEDESGDTERGEKKRCTC